MPNSSATNVQMMQYDALRKSAGVAFALWFFVGSFGGHRFYMGKTGSAVAMLVITLLCIPLTFAVIGLFGLAAIAVWALVDAFCIPGWVRSHSLKLASTLG
jgi:TM2 domain-containing membrane protein YozV